tara:strand:- start:201 stop:392 length:192 start_codon:yes stop_codon:yes gene_type:complete
MNKQQFKQARIKLGLSITELSKELGLGSPRWIRRIESTNEKDINNKPSLQLQKAFELLIEKRS